MKHSFEKREDVLHAMTVTLGLDGSINWHFVNPETWPIGRMETLLEKAPRYLRTVQVSIRYAKEAADRKAEQEAKELQEIIESLAKDDSNATNTEGDSNVNDRGNDEENAGALGGSGEVEQGISGDDAGNDATVSTGDDGKSDAPVSSGRKGKG